MDSRTDHSVADDEVARFLAENPDIVGLDVLLPDGNGVMRGKRIPRDGIAKIYRDGVRFPGSLYALDITGADVVEAGLVWERGDADYIGWPVPDSLKRAPWHARPLGQVLLSMYDESGAPFFLDPRHVLKRVLDRYAADGLTPVVAIELEFYLIDRELARDGRPQPPRSPHTGRRESTVQPLIMTSLDDFETFFARVEQATHAQDIPAEAAIAEAGPGQYEINLHYNAHAVAAADQGVLLKHLVKGVAASCGFEATFMAKPYGEESGNGLHIHMSLLDRDGRNVFDDGTARGSDAACDWRVAGNDGGGACHLRPQRELISAVPGRQLRADLDRLGVQQPHHGSPHSQWRWARAASSIVSPVPTPISIW